MARVVLYTAPWSKSAGLYDKLATVVASRSGEFSMVNAASEAAKSAGLTSLPAVQVWMNGNLVGQMSGQINDVKLVNLLDTIDCKTAGQVSAGRLRSSLISAMAGHGDVGSALEQFKRTVEQQMRGGSADAEDIKLLARGTLFRMLSNDTLDDKIRHAIKGFLAGSSRLSLDTALSLYGAEFVSFDLHTLSNEKTWEAQSLRPCRTVLELMMTAMGPMDNDVLDIRSKLQLLLDRKPTSTVIPKVVLIRRGGLPRRLLNGKWMWEGPHWSMRNKKQIKTGHSSRMFDRIGA